MTALVEAALDGRELAPVWRRNAGELDPVPAARLAERRREVLARLPGCRVGPGEAPSPRARAALAICGSVGQRCSAGDRDRYMRLLVYAVMACLTAPLPPASRRPTAPAAAHAALLPHARSEALLAVAGRMFAERSYPAVSLEQIAAATGVAGRSIYKHFPGKSHLLAAILRRGTEALWFTFHGALAGAVDHRDALDRLVDSYLDVIGHGTGAVSVLLTEAINLPDGPREEFRAGRRLYVAEWAALLVACRDDLDGDDARILVHAALAVANALTHRDPAGLGVPQDVPIETAAALVRAVFGLTSPRST